MYFMNVSLSAGFWLVFSLACWPHRPAQVAVSGLVGVAAVVLSAAAVAWPRLRAWVGVTAPVLFLSTLILSDGKLTIANDVVVAALLFLPSVAPERVVRWTQQPAAPATPAEPEAETALAA